MTWVPPGVSTRTQVGATGQHDGGDCGRWCGCVRRNCALGRYGVRSCGGGGCVLSTSSIASRWGGKDSLHCRGHQGRAIFCNQPHIHPTLHALVVHKGSNDGMGRDTDRHRGNIILGPGPLSVAKQRAVRPDHSDGVGARCSLNGKDGDPLTVGGQPVLHSDGAGVVIQHRGRIAARGTLVNLLPRAIIGSQGVV